MNSDTPLVRTLRVLELIQNNPGITGEAIASRVGISTRAVRRHVASIRDAGFTITSLPGPGGGYQLERGSRTPMVFTPDEVITLAMALSETPHTFSEGPALSVASKVLKAIPPSVAAPAVRILEAATAMPAAVDPRPRPDIVRELALAIDCHHVVRFTYLSAGKPPAAKEVEPWGLVVRHHHWYLVGRNHTHHAIRTYRVDRITDTTTLPEQFVPPDGLDILEVFETHLRESWTHPTHVDIHAPIDQATAWIPFTMGTLTATGPDTCRLQGRTNNCKAYLLDLLHTPIAFTITGGPHLLAAAQELATRTGLAAHGT